MKIKTTANKGLCAIGATNKISAVYRYSNSVWAGHLSIVILFYIVFSTFNRLLNRAGRILLPRLTQSPNVMCHPIEHPAHIQTSMTLPTRPHAIFSTLQGTQNPDTKPWPCKELKMPTHSLQYFDISYYNYRLLKFTNDWTSPTLFSIHRPKR